MIVGSAGVEVRPMEDDNMNEHAWKMLLVWQEETGGQFNIIYNTTGLRVELTAGIWRTEDGERKLFSISSTGRGESLIEATEKVLESWSTHSAIDDNPEWSSLFNPYGLEHLLMGDEAFREAIK